MLTLDGGLGQAAVVKGAVARGCCKLDERLQ
jgi:hypothetical protein